MAPKTCPIKWSELVQIGSKQSNDILRMNLGPAPPSIYIYIDGGAGPKFQKSQNLSRGKIIRNQPL